MRPISSAAPRVAGGQEGWIDYIPAYFSELPGLIARNMIPADVVFTMASPMDEHGYFSLSLGTDYTMAAVEKARAVVSSQSQRALRQWRCHVHISQVTALRARDPIFEVGLPKIGPVQEAIGSMSPTWFPTARRCRSATAVFPTPWSCS